MKIRFWKRDEPKHIENLELEVEFCFPPVECAEPESVRFNDDNEPVVLWQGQEVIDENSGKSPCGMYGWSITAGELKRALRDVPDDYEVMLENAEVDEMDISNVNINRMLPPFKGSPGLVVLGGGQIVSWEYGYERRMEAVYGEEPDPNYPEKRWYAKPGEDRAPEWRD